MFITCQRLKNCRYTINAIRLNFFFLLKKKHKSFHLRSIGKYEKKKKKKRFSLLRLKGGLLTLLERLLRDHILWNRAVRESTQAYISVPRQKHLRKSLHRHQRLSVAHFNLKEFVFTRFKPHAINTIRRNRLSV